MEIVALNKPNSGTKIPAIKLASVALNTNGLMTDDWTTFNSNGVPTIKFATKLISTRDTFITEFFKHVFGLEDLFGEDDLQVGGFLNQIELDGKIIHMSSVFDINASNSVLAHAKNRAEFVESYGKIKQRYKNAFDTKARELLSKKDSIFNSLDETKQKVKINEYRKQASNDIKNIFTNPNVPIETLNETAKQFANLFSQQGIDRASIVQNTELIVKVLDYLGENYNPYSVSLVVLMEEIRKTRLINLSVYKKTSTKSNFVTYTLNIEA